MGGLPAPFIRRWPARLIWGLLALPIPACTTPATSPPGEFGAEGVGFGHPDHASHVEAIDEIIMAPIRAGMILEQVSGMTYEELLTDDAYAQMIGPGDLNDGTTLRYALGLATTDILGHRAIHHGGGINGFLSESLYLPGEDLAVAVLVNSTGPPGPSALALEIVTLLVGDATPEPAPFEGEGDAATVLRWDQRAGYSVMARQ